MPTYDYVCDNCGHEFENFQSIKSEPLKKCPVCGEDKLRRLIGGGAGLIFKGSGFYLTDYKNNKESGKSTSSKDKTSKEETTSKKESASETKTSDPVTKSEPKAKDSSTPKKAD